MANHLMIDIETLGICATSVVLSVGAVIFNDEYNIIAKKLYILDKKEQLAKGRTYNQGTIDFWNNQPVEAKRQFKTDHVYSIEEFKSDFSNFVKKYDIVFVWSTAPNLDISCIQTLFEIDKYGGSSIPWDYNKIRDVRTVRDYLREYPKREGIYHDAIDDCIYQIECLKLSIRDMFIYGYQQVNSQLKG